MVHLIIERHIAETLESAYEQRSKRLLQSAVSASGFISGETLRDAKDPNHRVTLCKWRSATEWELWHHSATRKALLAEIEPMLDREEKVTILEQS